MNTFEEQRFYIYIVILFFWLYFIVFVQETQLTNITTVTTLSSDISTKLSPTKTENPEASKERNITIGIQLLNGDMIRI